MIRTRITSQISGAGVWRHLALMRLLGMMACTPLAWAQSDSRTSHPTWRDAKSDARQAHVREAVTEDRLTQPGDYRFTMEHGGLQRAYLVHVPPNYNAKAPTPVVLAFHGGGGNMALQAGPSYDIVGKSDPAGFVAVFPNGYSPLPGGKLATWNAGNCCGGARDRAVDDVGFVRAVLAQLKQKVNVDTQRIFATGMSNGAMLSHRLACEMADVFRAVAPVAGTDGTLQCAPSRPISILQIHASDDDHVLFNGGAGAAAFPDKTRVADFLSVPETMARWVRRNRCSTTTQRVLDVPGAYCETHTQCADGVQVQLCVTNSGGHSWPGARQVRAGKAPASQALSANDVMWDFFTRMSAR